MRFDHSCINKLLEQEAGMKIDCMKMFCKDWKDRYPELERKAIVSVFRRLVKHCQFDPILRFVHDVFSTRCDRYGAERNKDLVYLKGILSEVPIVYANGEQGTLAELVETYVQTLSENISARYSFIPQKNIKGIDIFTDCPDELFKWPVNHAEIIRYVVGWQIVDSLFIKHDVELCEEAVDEMVTSMRQRAEEAYRKECESIDNYNMWMEKAGQPDRNTYPDFTEFKRDLAIPGMLLPFIMTEEMKEGKQELCYYMMEKYVFPVLEAAPWDEERNRDIPYLAQTVRIYADYVQALQWWSLPNTEDVHSPKEVKAAHEHSPVEMQAAVYEQYVNKTLYNEAMGLGDPEEYCYTNSKWVEYAQHHAAAFKQWANILHNGERILKQVLGSERYSFHMLNTPYMLCLIGQTEEACQFLLRHYSDIGEYEACKPQLIIQLARCIRNASRLETANALYGIFSREMDRLHWDEGQMLNFNRKMVKFLRDARAYIQVCNETDHIKNISLFEMLFGDGRIDRNLEQCEEQLRDEGAILNIGLFQELAVYVEAFSGEKGVSLSKLGLKHRYGREVLEAVLDESLLLRAQALASRVKDARVFYTRQAQAETLRAIDLHLQLHLSQKQKEGVKEKLVLANQLKEKMRNKEMDEAQREAFLKEIEAITEELVVTARGARQWRPEVEREIAENRRAFEEKYANVLGENKDLMNKLEENVRKDVQNYLVTSNMVFKMMKTQHEGESRDDKNLDYSAALISMTKALELVMKHIYIKVNHVNKGGKIYKYSGMEKKDWSHYAWWDEKTKTYVVKTKNQTLQPCINILMDRNRIEAWKIEEVLDLGLLKDFGEIRDLDVKRLNAFQKNDEKEIEKHKSLENDPWMLRVNKLRLALGHVCQKYRNGSAHTEVITLVNVEECQKMLITGQNLLWILLAILK